MKQYFVQQEESRIRKGSVLNENCSVKVNEKGFIEVNESFQTANKSIYAVDDCIETIASAHTAYAEANIAVQNIINH